MSGGDYRRFFGIRAWNQPVPGFCHLAIIAHFLHDHSRSCTAVPDRQNGLILDYLEWIRVYVWADLNARLGCKHCSDTVLFGTVLGDFENEISPELSRGSRWHSNRLRDARSSSWVPILRSFSSSILGAVRHVLACRRDGICHGCRRNHPVHIGGDWSSVEVSSKGFDPVDGNRSGTSARSCSSCPIDGGVTLHYVLRLVFLCKFSES